MPIQGLGRVLIFTGMDKFHGSFCWYLLLDFGAALYPLVPRSNAEARVFPPLILSRYHISPAGSVA
jgi:hypothetical protein